MAEAPLTAAYGAHDSDFPVLACTTQTVELHVFAPADIALEAHVAGVHDRAPEAIAVHVVEVHDLVPAVIPVEVHVVEVHDFVPGAIPVEVHVRVTHDRAPEDIGVQVVDRFDPVPPPAGVDPLPVEAGDDPDGCPIDAPVVESDAQPVCAGFVRPIP